MKSISLEKIHHIARSTKYYEFENMMHKGFRGTLETEAKSEMFLIDSNKPNESTLEEIKEWYASKTKRKVFEFDEYDLHICSVVFEFSNDQNK